ncbi:arsenate reductase (glutaredoxin) [Pseudaeromonas sharmana]|uniref:Arsenate reductase n=1 Tax=Pseudaeromonas sharmana TaxID=328412 RepID=A0ABV8CS20_9GAMM
MSLCIYHNPRCSKSRETLALLESRQLQPNIIRYLETPPDITTLRTLVSQLGLSSVRDMMRRKDALYSELKLDNPQLGEEDLLQVLVDNPQLLERPIVVKDGQARIGRPPEHVLAIL